MVYRVRIPNGLMKLIICDLETTGLDIIKHEIIELGFIIADSEIFKVYGKFNFKCIPEHIKTASKKALEVNGYDKKVWKNEGIPLKDALLFFSKASENCVFISHNVAFDWSFIDINLNRLDIEIKMDYHKLDTLSMAWALIPHHKLTSWSLKTLCTLLGIPPEPKVHRAINGAEKAFEVYKKLMVQKCNCYCESKNKPAESSNGWKCNRKCHK